MVFDEVTDKISLLLFMAHGVYYIVNVPVSCTDEKYNTTHFYAN